MCRLAFASVNIQQLWFRLIFPTFPCSVAKLNAGVTHTSPSTYTIYCSSFVTLLWHFKLNVPPGEQDSLDGCRLIPAGVGCSQRFFQYAVLKAPIIGWRISEPLHKWITLVTNGGDLIMTWVKVASSITVHWNGIKGSSIWKLNLIGKCTGHRIHLATRVSKPPSSPPVWLFKTGVFAHTCNTVMVK